MSSSDVTPISNQFRDESEFLEAVQFDRNELASLALLSRTGEDFAAKCGVPLDPIVEQFWKSKGYVGTFKCKVKYRLSNEGQRDAIRRGLSSEISRTVTIDLPTYLLDVVSIADDGSCSINLEPDWNGYIQFSTGYSIKAEKFDSVPTRQELCWYISSKTLEVKTKLDEENKEKEIQKKEEVARKAECLRVIEKWIAGEGELDESGLSIKEKDFSYRNPEYFNWNYEDIPVEIAEKIKQYKKQKDEERERREKEEKQKEEQKKKDGIDKLFKWAQENGSERLKKMLKFGKEFSWIKVAEDEWFEANIPEGFLSDVPEQFKKCREGDRTKPTLPELELLETWRNTCAEDPRFIEAELHWNYNGRVKGASLDLTMVAPNGSTFRAFYFFEETFQETEENDD